MQSPCRYFVLRYQAKSVPCSPFNHVQISNCAFESAWDTANAIQSCFKQSIKLYYTDIQFWTIAK